jgi:hypothetical protein
VPNDERRDLYRRIPHPFLRRFHNGPVRTQPLIAFSKSFKSAFDAGPARTCRGFGPLAASRSSRALGGSPRGAARASLRETIGRFPQCSSSRSIGSSVNRRSRQWRAPWISDRTLQPLRTARGRDLSRARSTPALSAARRHDRTSVRDDARRCRLQGAGPVCPSAEIRRLLQLALRTAFLIRRFAFWTLEVASSFLRAAICSPSSMSCSPSPVSAIGNISLSSSVAW